MINLFRLLVMNYRSVASFIIELLSIILFVLLLLVISNIAALLYLIAPDYKRMLPMDVSRGPLSNHRFEKKEMVTGGMKNADMHFGVAEEVVTIIFPILGLGIHFIVIAYDLECSRHYPGTT